MNLTLLSVGIILSIIYCGHCAGTEPDSILTGEPNVESPPRVRTPVRFNSNFNVVREFDPNNVDEPFDHEPGSKAALPSNDEKLRDMRHREQLALKELKKLQKQEVFAACANGDEKEVEDFISSRSKTFDKKDEDGRTPFHLAIVSKQSGVVSLLIRLRGEKIMSILEENGQKMNALHLAVSTDDLETVKAVFEPANPNLKRAVINSLTEDTLMTPLHLAVANGNLEIVKFLYFHWADPNIRNAEGKSPYDMALEMENQEIADAINDRVVKDKKPKSKSSFKKFFKL